ncbi:uncharacterized protein LOC131155367 [Malania oleifera]|uniref:uncharacterized protein LOC131155367 n=1 Tax=Malania oleifera TaxID=397392 RepID=UPI0025ADCC1D|nr:uncharacterized protein LOC131155367 [Malania oleifera]
MDSAKELSQRTRNKGFPNFLLRCSFAFLFVLFALPLSLLVAIAAVFVGDLSITTPNAVPSQCKIVSSGVDLRSAKVCELGLLNYKAKHVFYPYERKKFRCHYDYYWASIFKVEYKDHSSGQTRFALAEAPNEALPLECRPNFDAAWLTMDKFKVNETYECWYTSGISQVNIHHDGFFSCRAKDPSTMEMVQRFFFLFPRIFTSWFASRGRPAYWRWWETAAGVLTGFSTSLISISLFRLLQQMKCRFPRFCTWGNFPLAAYPAHFKRACLFVAYCSFMGWLVIQYGKRLGLLEIFNRK